MRNTQDQQFIRTVRQFYTKHGRHALPWRQTDDPYRILVSEVMCQQTQVDRVVPKYTEFLKQFPTFAALASAPLGSVLRAWQGLGYNRRAKLLHACAVHVAGTSQGTYLRTFPRTYEELISLPGIGPYTAGAIMAFAYNQPVPLIETNIRTVYLHHFYDGKDDVADRAILTHIERTLDRKHPRVWYSALMDYGSYLKQVHGNPNVRSRHYTKQSPFKGSNREIRGAILRFLAKGEASNQKLYREMSFSKERIDAQLVNLCREGLLSKVGRIYTLPK